MAPKVLLHGADKGYFVIFIFSSEEDEDNGYYCTLNAGDEEQYHGGMSRDSYNKWWAHERVDLYS
jgi:hypothetical protein